MTTDLIRETLHAVSAVLVWPVLIGLLALAALTLLLIGGFAREAWDRSRGRQRALEHGRAALDDASRSGAEGARELRLEEVLQARERRLR